MDPSSPISDLVIFYSLKPMCVNIQHVAQRGSSCRLCQAVGPQCSPMEMENGVSLIPSVPSVLTLWKLNDSCLVHMYSVMKSYQRLYFLSMVRF